MVAGVMLAITVAVVTAVLLVGGAAGRREMYCC